MPTWRKSGHEITYRHSVGDSSEQKTAGQHYVSYYS